MACWALEIYIDSVTISLTFFILIQHLRTSVEQSTTISPFSRKGVSSAFASAAAAAAAAGRGRRRRRRRRRKEEEEEGGGGGRRRRKEEEEEEEDEQQKRASISLKSQLKLPLKLPLSAALPPSSLMVKISFVKTLWGVTELMGNSPAGYDALFARIKGQILRIYNPK